MERAGSWIDGARANRFLDTARSVLNGDVYLVPVVHSLAAAGLADAVRDVLGRTELEGPLAAAVIEEDPGLAGRLRCAYRPPGHQLGVSLMSEASARRRLESMIVPRPPYSAPCGRTTRTDEAAALVISFLDAFAPRPTSFAEVDPSFLRGWTRSEGPYEPTAFPDGFHDSAMALAHGPLLALLVNNGSD